MKWKIWLHILKTIVMEDDLLLQGEETRVGTRMVFEVLTI